MTPTELTFEERVKMRRMLDALDQKEAGGMKEFDLAKPPVPPYQYREFPYLMYKRGEKPRSAHSSDERERMRAAGWLDDPPGAEEEAGPQTGDPDPTLLSKVNTSRTRR